MTRTELEAAIEAAGGDRKKAAAAAGVPRRTWYRMLHRAGIPMRPRVHVPASSVAPTMEAALKAAGGDVCAAAKVADAAARELRGRAAQEGA